MDTDNWEVAAVYTAFMNGLELYKWHLHLGDLRSISSYD